LALTIGASFSRNPRSSAHLAPISIFTDFLT
jgi:hypothetical protein